MQEFYEFVADRRSIRKFLNTPITTEQLRRIMTASGWAPSAHNAQPWRFFILQAIEEKTRLAKTMAAVFRKDLEADGEEAIIIEDLVQASIERFSSAPVLILACLTMIPMDTYPDEKRRQAEFTMAVQSVAASIQMILLAAHAEGLAGCWFCAPLFCPETVRQALELSNELWPQALIILGEAAENPDPPSRQPLEEFVTFIGEKEV
ncbi:MAG: nitroreductase family protein [Promethearchaeota archaeon]